MRLDNPDGPTGGPMVPREGSGGRDAPPVTERTGDLGATAGGGASLPPPLCPHLEGPVLQLQKRGWGPLLNEIGEIGMLTAWEILSIYFLSTEALFR